MLSLTFAKESDIWTFLWFFLKIYEKSIMSALNSSKRPIYGTIILIGFFSRRERVRKLIGVWMSHWLRENHLMNIGRVQRHPCKFLKRKLKLPIKTSYWLVFVSRVESFVFVFFFNGWFATYDVALTLGVDMDIDMLNETHVTNDKLLTLTRKHV